MEPKIIQLAALGRALHPGTLYDCRNDSFIPGITLWDDEIVKKGIVSRRQPKTHLDISASDSLIDKTKLLDVSASLKASFLGGLVDVGGSAKYLNDNKTSARQSRVSLQYSQTTRFDQLSMDQLGNIKYQDVFDDGTATHIVTAVLYGAQAFMVFDLTASENENKEEIEGNLNVMVRKIPSFSIEGEGAVTMTETEKELANNISCRFYGDYELENNPTTYKEALQLYRKLPSLLRQRENDAVPVKVWLYPLSRLSDKAATLEREIHKTLISKIESLLEELKDAEAEINDMITSTILQDFQEVKLRLQKFKNMLDEYKVKFLKAINELLPAIRGGKVQEQELADIITIHEKSPFRAEKLNRWLEYSQGEINVLTLYTQQLTDVPVIKYTAIVSNILSNPNVDTVMCFCFTSLSDKDPYLSILTEFLKADEFKNLSPVRESNQDANIWFNKPEVIKNFKVNLILFRSFFQANNDNARIRFIIVSASDPSSPGTSIHLYRRDKKVDKKFQPVSKPPAPEVTIQDRNIILKLQVSPTGSTVKFQVEHKIFQATDLDADVEKWEIIQTPDAQEKFTLTGLQLTKQYTIRYRAVSDIGMSEASDSILFSPQGKLKCSLGLKWKWSNLSFISELRSKVMNSLGTSQCGPSSMQPLIRKLENNLAIPYEKRIVSGMKEGIAFHYQGVIPKNSNFFVFQLKTGTGEDADVAFSLKIFPQMGAYLNTRVDGTWIEIGIVYGCPLLQGSAFNALIVIGNESYVVYLNGRRYCTMKHSIPVKKVAAVNFEGDVVINSFGGVPTWSMSTFGKDQKSRTSRWELSKAPSGGAQPFCKPNQPYLGQIPGGLKCGQTLYFQGVVPSDGTGFEINLKTGPNKGDDVAFQFKAQPHAVVCNCYKNGQWQDPESTEEMILTNGEDFDILMFSTPLKYEVMVNGRKLCFFKHRIPVHKVTTLQIDGDVFMSTCANIPVDRFNLTLNLAAHI